MCSQKLMTSRLVTLEISKAMHQPSQDTTEDSSVNVKLCDSIMKSPPDNHTHTAEYSFSPGKSKQRYQSYERCKRRGRVRQASWLNQPVLDTYNRMQFGTETFTRDFNPK